ncbi:MAG: S41 family peptidase [Candidatus Levybacteria bacterium]|nr:S41 family peptidase [Candidatus Levybacteria bacterium]
MRTNILHLAVIALIAGLIGYQVGVSKISFEWKQYKPKITVESRKPPTSLQTVDFSLFWSVWEKVENSYYDKTVLDPQKLLNGAISGMVQSLGDPYTVFLPPTQNNDFKQGLSGQFQGIGAELGIREKQIIVIAPLDGTPAQKSGIKAGDAILKVDGKDTTGWTLSQAVEKIRGPKGTEVILTILRKEEEKPKGIKIVRDTITVKSVTGWVRNIKYQKEKSKYEILNEGEKCDDCLQVTYIRLSQFGDRTNQEWLTLVNDLDLKIKNNPRFKGVILDLRNNPGGYLGDANFIASEFIKSGTVVIQDKGNNETSSLSVSRKGLLTEVPLIVLINKGSASASEIVAGALRDQKKTLLLGETSFGKGTIQQAEDLGNGAGLHVTIAKWLTPNGTWVHEKGLTPDISVSSDEKDQARDTQLEKAIEELVK